MSTHAASIAPAVVVPAATAAASIAPAVVAPAATAPHVVVVPAAQANTAGSTDETEHRTKLANMWRNFATSEEREFACYSEYWDHDLAGDGDTQTDLFDKDLADLFALEYDY